MKFCYIFVASNNFLSIIKGRQVSLREGRKMDIRKKSLNHKFWLDDYEILVRNDQVYKAHKSDTFDFQGNRIGRWECSVNHWNYYAVRLGSPLIIS